MVDLQSLNAASTWETHYTESPFHLATQVPNGTLKRTYDAWNGYHQVPLREQD
jgi:hypothetical protein